MYRSIVFVLVTVCFFVIATHANSEPNFQEGMWEMTMSATMTGLDGMMPPMQAKSCMMKKDLSPEKFHSEGDCKAKDIKISGDTVKWRVSCKTEDGVFDGTGTMVYKGTTFEGNTQISGKDEDGEKMEIKTKIIGKRIGPCK
ncbi:MAG: lipoprotein [Deltaproteobacteria bacterium]|nr:lipoprotein [Deltaproteobacteria bacterium]